MEGIFLSQNSTEKLIHIIKEVDAFINTDHGKELSDEIHSLFRELKESLKSKNMGQRKTMRIAFDMGRENSLNTMIRTENSINMLNTSIMVLVLLSLMSRNGTNKQSC